MKVTIIHIEATGDQQVKTALDLLAAVIGADTPPPPKALKPKGKRDV